MSQARATFWQRIEAIRTAITDYALHDLPLLPANTSRNASVRVIRNGLAVQCFNVLEDFIKARATEVLADISRSSIQFSWLPGDLQEATTLCTVKALTTQIKRRERSTRVQYVQTYGAKIASTLTGALDLPDIGFFHVNSNISPDDLRDAIAAFGVSKPWPQLSGLLSRMNLSALPADNVFSSLASRRHAAAHDPTTSVSENDLLQGTTDATSIAIGFDLLVTHCTRSILRLTSLPSTTGPLLSDHAMIALRFIKPSGKQFIEIRENGRRSVARDINWRTLLPNASARSLAKSEALVVVDSGSRAIHWDY